MIKAKLTFLLVMLFPFSLAVAQIVTTKKYDIRVAGIKIGELSAQQKQVDSLTVYTLESKVQFWFFGFVRIHYLNIAQYHYQQLISSLSTSTTSKGTFHSSVLWKDNAYEVNAQLYHYSNQERIQQPVYFNISRLYFERPQQGERILADGYGIVGIARTNKDNSISIRIDGHDNFYFYSRDGLNRVRMFNRFKDYEIIERSD